MHIPFLILPRKHLETSGVTRLLLPRAEARGEGGVPDIVGLVAWKTKKFYRKNE
jgi:hypothetical protein